MLGGWLIMYASGLLGDQVSSSQGDDSDSGGGIIVEGMIEEVVSS